MDYRRRQLIDLSARLGFDYCEDDRYGLGQKLDGFHLTGKGIRKKFYNVLRQQDGLMEYNIYLADYTYRSLYGGSDKLRHQTVFFVESFKLGLPQLRMRPEHLHHKLGELLGMQDIDFVRFPKFSGQYRLTGDDEVYIRHHFNDDVLNYFTLNRGWHLEALGYYLLFYKPNTLLPPEQIAQFYQRCLEIFHLFREEDPAV